MINVRDSLRQGNFHIEMQPIVYWGERRILSFEVLACLDPVALGLCEDLQRDDIARLIEENDDLGQVLDQMVIEKSLHALRNMTGVPENRACVSINIFASTLAAPDFVEDLCARAQAFGIAPERISLEVTETTLLTPQIRDSVVPVLADRGFGIIVDHFISGQSGFAVLTNPHVHLVKIDASVTLGLESSDIARRLLRGLLLLAEALDKHMVIEGVDTYARFLFLEAIGYSRFQGLCFGRPMPPGHIAEFMEQFNRQRMPTIFEAVKEDVAQPPQRKEG